MFKINDIVYLKNKPNVRGIIVHFKKVGGIVYYTLRIDDNDELYAENELKRYDIEYMSIEEKVKKDLFIPFKDVLLF